MTRRQSRPDEWLIIDRGDMSAVKCVPRGKGVLVALALTPLEERQLRRLARSRQLTIVRESLRCGTRVHNLRELTQAVLRRCPLILLSPVYPTRSHPDWKPLPRMRAATLAGLTKRRAVALGGMNRRRFAAVAPLGFIGWAGISAFRT